MSLQERLSKLSSDVASLVEKANSCHNQSDGKFCSTGGSKSAKLAATYVELHNAAAKEYKKAFAEVGAKMWKDDNAHPLKKQNQEFIERNILQNPAPYRTLAYPLTVLDSYPNVSARDRQTLRTKVSAIHNKYSKQWQQALKETK